MIGIWSSHSSAFLMVVSALTLLLLGPMLINPLGWARVLRWTLPEHTDLAVYFGRCLGGVVAVLAIMGFVAARQPAVQPFYFALMITEIAVIILIHIWGALKNIQPVTETMEIVAWVLLLLGALAFHPAQ